MSEILKEYSDKLTDNRRAQVSAQIDEVYTELMKVENAKLPEEVFVAYFLDHFRSGDNNIHSELNLKWLEVSGGPYNEVDIIDNQGNYLYTVPPLMIRPSVDETNNNYTEIIKTFTLKTNNMPAIGLNYLNGKITNLPNEIMTPEKQMVVERWITIFNMYPIDPLNQACEEQPSQQSNLDDFVNYD